MSLAIEEHGIIGNLRSVALVGTNGSIDWCCLPNFDSPSVFGALLDDARGGHFQICATDPESRSRQTYLPDTNVLITRFLHPDGVGELVDFMPLGLATGADCLHRIVRRVSVVRGALTFRLECHPGFDYARARHHVTAGPDGVLFQSPKLALRLHGSAPLRALDDRAVAEFRLEVGQSAVFVLEAAEDGRTFGTPSSPQEVEEWFHATIAYWRRWLSRSTYVDRGHHRRPDHQSA
jgi:GH15 family glucan-1,4-alpha-glucosidase